jgi:hypothetical protein
MASMAEAPPRPLTPMEKANLTRLLQQNDAFAAFVANSPTAAEERRLRAEQASLVKKEAKAAVKMRKLQVALDEVTTKL